MINEEYVALFRNEQEVENLTRRILKEGCVSLPNFFDQQTVDRVMQYARSLSDQEKIRITWQTGTPAMDIARSDEFMRVFDSIHKARCKIDNISYTSLKPGQQAVSLPIKTVHTPGSTPFHFDDSYVNAVFAMKMPPNNHEGNLLIYKNLRRRIKPLLLSKIVARLLRHSALLRLIIKPKEIAYREGALHIFFGDLTLHGVPDLTDGERVTFTLNAHRGKVPS
jgi:hypothetical protein